MSLCNNFFFSIEIRSSFPCIDAISKSSIIKGSTESVGEHFYGIMRVVGKTVTRYPSPSGNLEFDFEGEKVSVLWRDERHNTEKILRQLNHHNVIKPYFRVSRYYFAW